MSHTRRQFIQLLGAGGAVAIVGLATATQLPQNDPYLPWQGEQQWPKEVRLRAIYAAILAPNPHNLQPWRLDLATDNRIVLLHLRTRQLPASDPYQRQITLGHGAFIELLDMALREQGYRSNITFNPALDYQGSGLDTVASFDLVRDPTVERDPLFSALHQRRTNRNPHDMTRFVAAATMESMQRVLREPIRFGYAVNAAEIEPLRRIAADAWRIECTAPKVLAENIHHIHIGSQEIAAQPEGISLKGGVVAVAQTLGLLSREQLGTVGSNAHQRMVDEGLQSIRQTAAYCWLVTSGNTRSTQISAGRAYVRLNLAATQQGLAIQPNSQALQEYPAMLPTYVALHRRLAPSEQETVQMLVRIGYADPVSPAPRYPAEQQLL